VVIQPVKGAPRAPLTAQASWPSLWEGYLNMLSGVALRELLAEHQISLTSVYTSAHAAVFDLRRLVEACGPTKVVPIHSEAGDRFAELFLGVESHAEGNCWEVRQK
jgi:ribonuclease J